MDKKKEIQDPEIRAALISVFNSLDEKKVNIISKIDELTISVDHDSVLYVQKNLLELLEQVKSLNYSLSSLATLIYGDGSITNAYSAVCFEQGRQLGDCQETLRNAAFFEKKEKGM